MTNLDRIIKDIQEVRDLHNPLTEYASEDLEYMLKWLAGKEYLLEGAVVFWDDEMESLCIERQAKNIGWILIYDSKEEEGVPHNFETGGNFWIGTSYSGGGADPFQMIEPIETYFRHGGKYLDDKE